MTVITVTAHHIFSLPSASCFVFVCLKANMPQNYKNQPHIADMETILSLPVDLGTTCGHLVFLPISDSFISSSFPAVMSPVSLSLSVAQISSCPSSHAATLFMLVFPELSPLEEPDRLHNYVEIKLMAVQKKKKVWMSEGRHPDKQTGSLPPPLSSNAHVM